MVLEVSASSRGSNDEDNIRKVRVRHALVTPILPPYTAMVFEAVAPFGECTRQWPLAHRRTAHGGP